MFSIGIFKSSDMEEKRGGNNPITALSSEARAIKIVMVIIVLDFIPLLFVFII
jgi:hypothetical protein